MTRTPASVATISATAIQRAHERNDLLSRLLCAAQKLGDADLLLAIKYVERKAKKR